MQVGIIIGESAPLVWDRWRHLCGLIERLGFDSLFRSDHYFNGVQKDAIDVFLSFVMAAEQTTTIRFGPLVTPITFRSPVNVGRMAQQLDALSGGRFVLGLGTGWHRQEHDVYGVDFGPRSERYDRLVEAIALMRELWYSNSGTFAGQYYQLAGTDSKPHPPSGRPPILIGGTGPKRTLRIVAESAAEWNATPLGVDEYRRAGEVLERHCDDVGRDPAEIRRSMLVFSTLGPDAATEAKLLRRFLDMYQPGASLEDAIAARHVPWQGSTDQLLDYLGRLRELGLEEIVFDHLCHDDDEILEWLATEIKPAVHAL